METQEAKISTPTPSRELRRYGLKKAFVNRYGFAAVLVGFLFAALVPRGQGELLSHLLGLHGVLAGFGFSVFTFAILGGRDEFFTSVIASKKAEGVEAVQNLILHLFWPFVIQLVLIIFCITRLLFISVDFSWVLVYLWRFLYGIIAVHGFFELYFAMRLMFGLAIGRLHHLFRLVSSEPEVDTDEGGQCEVESKIVGS